MLSPAFPTLADPNLLRSQAWLDGQWVDAPSQFEVTNPANGARITSVPNLSPAEA